MVGVTDHPVVDSDVDLHDPAQRAELKPHAWPVLTAISAGGALGGLARYGVGVWVPQLWSTFLINVLGCLLIGAFMATPWSHSRLTRPFLGVGVLGGFTTFSAYALDIRSALVDGRAGTALLYLAGTLAGAVVAVWAGMAITRKVIG